MSESHRQCGKSVSAITFNFSGMQISYMQKGKMFLV